MSTYRKGNMIGAVDIETRSNPETGLIDARNYRIGCLWLEMRKDPEIYRTREELWARIIEAGRMERKRGKCLTLYGHYHKFDFYGYADLKDNNIRIFSEKPFIASYMDTDGKEIITLLDSMSLYPMSLKDVGELIGLEKMEIDDYDKASDEDLIPYCKRDTEIVLKAVRQMRDLLNTNENYNLKCKKLYSTHQIAINRMLKCVSEKGDKPSLFYNQEKRWLIRPARECEDIIHEAYRAGRVEAWKTGVTKDVTTIDVNSLYPYAATRIKLPDLRTERKVMKMTLEDLNKEGVCQAAVYNRDCDIGLLMIRTNIGGYFPRKGKIIAGTWTTRELRTALKEGYRIIYLGKGVVYEGTEDTCIADYMRETYKRRSESKNSFENKFYKDMMNGAIGKLAQRRASQEYIIDSVDEAKAYLEANYSISRLLREDEKNRFVYHQKYENRKSYYAPIIPALINAEARIIMYYMYKLFGRSRLVYTDTDSVTFTGDIEKEIVIGKGLGESKIVHNKEEANIWGRKARCIGNDIAVSGVNKKSMTMEAYKKGEVETLRMLSIHDAKNISEAGGFKQEMRDLKQQMREHEMMQSLLQDEKVFIEATLINFKEDLARILEEITKWQK